MASVQEPGFIEFVGIDANGQETILWNGDVQALGPGGSDTYVPANATQDKWTWFNKNQKIYGPGSRFAVYYTPVGVDTLDASDCFFNIPLRIKGVGTVMMMNSTVQSNGGLGAWFTADQSPADVTTVAGQRIRVQVMRALEGTTWRFGGAKGFLSIEDDT